MSMVFEAASFGRSGRFESAAVIVKCVDLMLIDVDEGFLDRRRLIGE